MILKIVGEIPIDLQGKLLRALQERQFERVGDDKTIGADVRIVAATNRDLEVEVANGNFREDLYYRLSVFPVTVPPLRERVGDIVPLARHFVEQICKDLGRPALQIGQGVSDSLQSHKWPGNIRELRNVIERAIIMSKGERLELSLSVASPDAPMSPSINTSANEFYTDAEMREYERSNIQRVIKRTKWRVSGDGGAAELLGLKASTLAYRMKNFGIEKGEN